MYEIMKANQELTRLGRSLPLALAMGGGVTAGRGWDCPAHARDNIFGLVFPQPQTPQVKVVGPEQAAPTYNPPLKSHRISFWADSMCPNQNH